MQKETILVALIAVLVGGISGYALGEMADHGSGFWGDRGGHGDMMGGQRQQRAAENKEWGGLGMTSGDDLGQMGHMMDMMVASEREFIEEMIPHHQEAVDTAKEVIARGATTPDIKALVEGIIVAQEKEIAEMKAWYQSWYGEEYNDKGTYHTMMRELTNFSGVELDKAFLEDMIMHHMGAIMMARSVDSYIEHNEIRELTANIVRTQSDEIQKMRSMLQGL